MTKGEHTQAIWTVVIAEQKLILKAFCRAEYFANRIVLLLLDVVPVVVVDVFDGATGSRSLSD